MKRTYKGYQIVKQIVGAQGWNIVAPNGRCVKTGSATLSDARNWITAQIEGAY